MSREVLVFFLKFKVFLIIACMASLILSRAEVFMQLRMRFVAIGGSFSEQEGCGEQCGYRLNT